MGGYTFGRGDEQVEKLKELKEAQASHKSDRGVTNQKTIPLEDIDRMLEMYCLEFPIVDIAKEIGITSATVHKYIRDGDPKRSIKPLRERRAEVFKRVMEDRDGVVAMSIIRLLKTSVGAAEATGKRVTERILAAHKLEDEALYAPGNEEKRIAAEVAAYNPDAGDFNRVILAAAKAAEVSGKLFIGDKSNPKTSVSVNASSDATAQSLSIGDGSEVLEHFAMVRKAQDSADYQETIPAIVKSLAEGSTAEE